MARRLHDPLCAGNAEPVIFATADRAWPVERHTHTFGVLVFTQISSKSTPCGPTIAETVNRRVLEVEQLTHDCHIGAEAFAKLQKPAEVDGQHAAALPFGQGRVQALLMLLVMFCLQPDGFRNRQLRPLLAQLLGPPEAKIRYLP